MTFMLLTSHTSLSRTVLLSVIWIVSCILAPWYVFIPIAIILGAEKNGEFVLVLGGAILDGMYGGTQITHFPVFYTLLFLILFFAKRILDRMILA